LDVTRIERTTKNVIDSDSRNVVLVIVRGYEELYEVHGEGLAVVL
jgi:hypothetical protein